MYRARFAILIDGGFLTKKLYARTGRAATADDVVGECQRLRALPEVDDYELLRIYYYDAPPSDEVVTTPITRARHSLAETQRFRQAQSLYDQLRQKPDMALRMGETVLSPDKWKIKPRTARHLTRYPRPLTDADFALDIGQKGVDMRVGMDIARLALREMVRAIVVVTADSDFIPAFTFARREGVRIVLDTMGHRARQDLKTHADVVLDAAV